MDRLTDRLLFSDLQLFQFLHTKVRCRILNWLMSYITYLGGATFNITVALLFIIFGYSSSTELGWELLFSLAASHLLVQIIKRKINRPRPYKVLDEIELTFIPFEAYSFPSGHTTASFSLATILSLYFPSFSLIFLLAASLVGISRIYLGVHYPSDVTIGAVIGVISSYCIYFWLI